MVVGLWCIEGEASHGRASQVGESEFKVKS
jgi:hypothetical protein